MFKKLILHLATGILKTFIRKMTPDIKHWLREVIGELQIKAGKTPNKFDDIVASLLLDIFT